MTSTTGPALAAALDHARGAQAQTLSELDELLRIESVSADPARDAAVRAAAAWVVDRLTSIGFEHAEAHETSAHPIVTADWLHAGPDRPTVLVYCHYDVQPTDPDDEWVRPPFEPRHEDARVYARGSGDDKGQIVIHLQAARAWMESAGRLPVNLRVLFEGDEEVGSEAVDAFIAEHPDLLAADLCVVSDTEMHDADTPALTYGLRGIAYFEVRVAGPSQDLHSGSYGGAVANPANVLVEMLASLRDDQGRITIPGFYDHVRPLTEADRAAYAQIPFDPNAYAESIGVPALWEGEAGYTPAERLSGRPTFDVNGLWGGYSGEGAKTIIPAWAAAKISMRLVPDQDYHEIEASVIRHLEAIAPPGVRVTVTPIHGGAPALTPLDHPAVEVAARALEETFGTPPVFLRSGGSIPVVAALDSHLGLSSVLVGFAAPNGNFHAPNEWIPEPNLHRGVEAIVRLWERIGELTSDELRT